MIGDKLRKDAIARVSKMRDELLERAILRTVGEGWTIETVAGRAYRVTQQGVEKFYLDNKLVLTIYPLEVTGEGVDVQCTFRYSEY